MIAALLIAAPLAAQAQAGDPLNSPECAAARGELELALGDDASNRTARARRIAQARSRAALACLGPANAKPERSGAPQPAQSVPPPVIAPPRAAGPDATSPVIAAPLPPLVIPRPTAITTCDPGGCWDSEGRRLNQMGPLLVGPNGLCSLQGGAVNCP